MNTVTEIMQEGVILSMRRAWHAALEWEIFGRDDQDPDDAFWIYAENKYGRNLDELREFLEGKK